MLAWVLMFVEYSVPMLALTSPVLVMFTKPVTVKLPEATLA